MSPISAIESATNKLTQYNAARDVGFYIPATRLTSSEDAARQFITRYPDSVVKTLASTFFDDENGNPTVFFTRKTSPSMNLGKLHLAPAVFQERIEGTYIRVTVVGEEAFAAFEIVTDSLQEKYGPEVCDSRLGQVEGQPNLEPFDSFPDDAKERCIALTKHLGLRFGAIDLIMDHTGEMWFLEINPNGQWGYVERTTGQQIGKAVARLLVGRDK